MEELSQIKKRQKGKNKFALAYPVLGFAFYIGTAYGVSCITGDDIGVRLYAFFYYLFFLVPSIAVVFTAEINKPKWRLAATVSVMGLALVYSIVFLAGFAGPLDWNHLFSFPYVWINTLSTSIYTFLALKYIHPQQDVPLGNEDLSSLSSKRRLIYILLALFLGYFGIHNFYAGYIRRGLAQFITLLVSVLTMYFFVSWLWALIEACTVTRDANNRPMI